jgi:hypothetical protein
MSHLKLYSKKYGNFDILIDRADFKKIKKYTWCVNYHNSKKIYIYTRIKNKMVYLHRFILNETNPKIIIDHINYNGLDNRKCNLRKCTCRQNIRHQRLHKNNTSGHRGIEWNKSNNNWRVRIKVDYNIIEIGSFNNITNAIIARNKAEKKYFKKFA